MSNRTDRLTWHERDVLLTYGELGDRQATATALGLSRHTIKNTLSNVQRKLGVDSSIGALYVVLTDGADPHDA